jgi:hypothetical protein
VGSVAGEINRRCPKRYPSFEKKDFTNAKKVFPFSVQNMYSLNQVKDVVRRRRGGFPKARSLPQGSGIIDK